MEQYYIECKCHTYISLYYGTKDNLKWLHCYDNDLDYMENIIKHIEKRTNKKFSQIEIKGNKEDFNGLRFLSGGFKRNWL